VAERFDRRRWALLAACAVGAASLVLLQTLGAEDPRSEGAVRDCRGAGQRSVACFADRYGRLVREAGPAQALRAFRADYERNPVVRAECHGLTHAIGRAAGERLRDVRAAFRRGDRFCGSGYFHGVVEAIVAGPERAQALARPDELCGGVRARAEGSVDHFNCAHGLGHGYMAIRANDLPAALAGCDRLRRRFERENCYAGAFMQNVMAEDDPRHPSRSLDPDRPLQVCAVLATRYRQQCLKRQVLYALERNRGDFRSVFALCARFPAGQRAACDRELGGAAAELNINSQPDALVQAAGTARLCGLAPDDAARLRCAEGATGYFVFHYDRTAEAKAFCRALGALERRCAQEADELLRRQRRAGASA